MLRLPVEGDVAHQSFTVDLDGEPYIIELRWNNRASAWFLSLYTPTNAPLLLGRRVVIGVPMLRRHRTPAFPPGEMLAVDTTGANQDPGANDLGARVVLMYATAAELRGMGL